MNASSFFFSTSKGGSAQARLLRWLLPLGVLILWSVGGCEPPAPPSPCGECKADERCDQRTKRCIPLLCSPCQQSIQCNNGEFCNDKGCCERHADGISPEVTRPEPREEEIASEIPTEITESTDGSEMPSQEVIPESSPESPDLTCPNPPCTCPQTPCPDGLCCNSQGSCVACGDRKPCQPCQDDAECGSGNRCFPLAGKSVCVLGCPDDQCPQKFQCLDLGAGRGKLCIPEADCPSEPLCTTVTCSGGNKCCEETGRCHVCCESTDCPLGQVCRIQGSSRRCESTPNGCPQECASDEVCNQQNRRCVKDCRQAGGCNPNEQCDGISGLCTRKDCRSNFNCPAGENCNNATGECEKPPPDCRLTPGSCTAPTCCNQTNGQCETGCRACGCTGSQTCNTTTNTCQTPVCQRRSLCSSTSDCCGASCVYTGLFELGSRRCSCTSTTQCQSGLTCEEDFWTGRYVCK